MDPRRRPRSGHREEESPRKRPRRDEPPREAPRSRERSQPRHSNSPPNPQDQLDTFLRKAADSPPRQLEIELRVGTYDHDRFISSVSESIFNRVLSVLSRSDHTKKSICEVDYNYENRSQPFNRLTTDSRGKPIRAITKRRNQTERIQLHGFPYELRASECSEREEYLPSSVPSGWESKRRKNRNEFDNQGLLWLIHMTTVTTERRHRENKVTFEVEFEMKDVQHIGRPENRSRALEEVLKLFVDLFGSPTDRLNWCLDRRLAVEDEERLRQACWRASVSEEARKRKHSYDLFPGSMPVSLSRRHFEEIRTANFCVSEKTDGIRYMMMVTGHGVYMIDRKFEFRPLLHAGLLQRTLSPRGEMTILDGELVETRIAPFNLTFMLFDIIQFQNTIVSQLPLTERLQSVSQVVSLYRSIPPILSADLPFSIIGKNILSKKDIRKLEADITEENNERIYSDKRRRCHLTDGFILTPSGKYHPRSTQDLFKWKYVDLLSVDFRILPHRNKLMMACLGNDNGTHRDNHVFCQELDKYGECSEQVLKTVAERRRALGIRETTTWDWLHQEPVIIEMTYDASSGLWRFHKERRDKNTPNHIRVVFDTMKCIAENITQSDLRALLQNSSV